MVLPSRCPAEGLTSAVPIVSGAVEWVERRLSTPGGSWCHRTADRPPRHRLAFRGESSKRCTRHLLLNRSLHTAMVRADHRGQDLLGQGRPSTGLGCNDGQPNRHIQKIVPAEVRCKNSPAQRSATAMTTGASLHPRQRSTRDRSGNLGRSFSR